MKKFLPLLYLFFGLFLIYPLFSLLQGAFVIESVQEGHSTKIFSLEYFTLIFKNPFYRDCFTNSLALALLSTLGCLLISIPLASLFQRTDFPGKSLFGTLLLVPLILPPFVGAIGLKQILARFGSLNLFLAHLGLMKLDHPIDWLGNGGFAGIIVLEILHLFPIMFLWLQAALGNVDPSLREAGKNLGSDRWHLFWNVTMPLAMPGIYASGSIIFVSAFTDLGVPLMFNFTTTIPTQIYNLVTQSDNPMGYALVVLTLILVAALFLIGHCWGKGHEMMARSSSHEERTQLKGLASLGAWVGVASVCFLSILPHLGVIFQSLSSHWFLTVLPQGWTDSHYLEVATLPLTISSLKNSLLYSGASAILDLVLGVVIAYLLARETFVGKGLIETLSMIPLALPGLVSAFAYFVAFSRGPFPKSMSTCNHLWLALFDPRQNPTFILIIAYSMHRLPYMVRAAYAGLQQTSVALEEASTNLGASITRTMIKVVIPLLVANLIAGSIMTFSFAMLDVSNGMILAEESPFYPLTKAIFSLLGRILPTAPSLACALGVMSMLFLGVMLWLSSRLFGKRTGELFNVGS